MTPDNEKPGNGLTVSALEQYIMRVLDERDRSYQQQFKSLEKDICAGLISAEKAVAVAMIAQEKAVVAAFNAQEKAVASALSAAERAVTKAELASEKRFDAVNEFRGTLTDQNATFLPRPEFDRAILALYDRVESTAKLITDRVESNTKAINDQMDSMQTYKDRTSGKADGMQAGWVILLGLVGLIGALITIVMTLKR